MYITSIASEAEDRGLYSSGDAETLHAGAKGAWLGRMGVTVLSGVDIGKL